MPSLDADHADPESFVREHTEVAVVPLLPEIRLRQANAAFLVWETTERDLAARGMGIPFWAFPWPGGIAVARYLLDQPEVVAGRRVLDLGSGSGLVAIAAALAGADHVVANDIDPLAVAAVELNAAVNNVTVEALGADLTRDAEHPAVIDAEVVIAGDIAYDQTMSEGVFNLVRRFASRGVEVLVGDPGRAHLPSSGLTELASYEVPVSRALEVADVKRATVWRVTGDV